jgi:hypothetical protein
MTKRAGRLAFREEGEFWNCYYAEMETMEGAVLLSSIRMVLVVDNGKIKRQYMEMMKGCLSYMIEAITDSTIEFWVET